MKVSRTVELSRQCIVPLEGKSVLAYWDFQADQLVVVSATQVPHLLRVGIAQHLSMNEEAVRVVSPTRVAPSATRAAVLEDLCIAWLAKTYLTPFRYLEDRREHLIVGANTRQHHYQLTAYVTARESSSRWTLSSPSTAVPIPTIPSSSVWSLVRQSATCRALHLPRLSLRDLVRRD